MLKCASRCITLPLNYKFNTRFSIVCNASLRSLTFFGSSFSQMLDVLESKVLWVNPDCGLKTRKYSEVMPALTSMVDAAKKLRAELANAN